MNNIEYSFNKIPTFFYKIHYCWSGPQELKDWIGKIWGGFLHFPEFRHWKFCQRSSRDPARFALLAQYKLEFISFYSGNRRVGREWRDQLASDCRIGENSSGQTVQSGSWTFNSRENTRKHCSFLEIHLLWETFCILWMSIPFVCQSHHAIVSLFIVHT